MSASAWKQQIVDFEEATADDHLDIGSKPDPTFDYGRLSDTYDLSDWFSRPIPIAAINWTQGATLDTILYPWHLYFTSPKITQKLFGYCRLRATLNIKLMINGTPFAYSLGLMSYKPLGDGGVLTDADFSGGKVDTSLLLDHRLVPYSQRPHVFFNPQDQRGCSMALPFIKQDNWIDLTNDTIDSQLKIMGDLRISSFAPLLLSNGSTGQSVEVSIYAWATDVELAGPSVAYQSGKSDEYGTSPLSDMATAVAASSGALSSVPVIGNYARATSMVSGTLATVAKALGYSKPPNIEAISPYKYNTNPSMANASVPLPMDVLAIDPKSELCVDPATVCGSSVDDSSISTIIQRDSYWFGSTWSVGAPTGTELLKFVVTPECYRWASKVGVDAGTYYPISMTPLCHTAQSLAYWQGDLIYTFKFVCSKFHRGRVRIFWEPDRTSAPYDSALNINHIVDLGSTTSFEMRVPFMKESGWGMIGHLPFSSPPQDYFSVGGAGLISPYKQFMNGMVKVDVLNELSAPDLTADVSVLVFVRAADNFSLAQPRGIGNFPGARAYYGDLANYQSGGDDVESGTNDVPDETHEMSNDLVMTVPRMDPHVYMGEKIHSLRQLFKRTSYYTAIFPEVSTATAEWITTSTQPRLPRQPGPDAAGMHFSTWSGGVRPFNFCDHNYVTWFTPCYVGWRGSMVWRNQVNPGHESLARASAFNTIISRSPYVTYYIDAFGNALNGNTVDSQATTGKSSSTMAHFFNHSRVTGTGDFMSGGACAVPENEPVNVANIPMYSAYRMHPANPALLSHPWDVSSEQPRLHPTDYCRDNVVMTTWSSGYNDVNQQFTAASFMYVAGGDDFTPFVYLNVPTVYATATEITPAVARGLNADVLADNF
jgi:hypothetical protein